MSNLTVVYRTVNKLLELRNNLTQRRQQVLLSKLTNIMVAEAIQAHFKS